MSVLTYLWDHGLIGAWLGSVIGAYYAGKRDGYNDGASDCRQRNARG